MSQYHLFSIAYFSEDLQDIGPIDCAKLCVAPRPSIVDIINKIQDLNKHVSKQDIYCTDVSNIVRIYSDHNMYPHKETNNFIKNNSNNILAAYGVDADETDTYVVVEINVDEKSLINKKLDQLHKLEQEVRDLINK